MTSATRAFSRFLRRWWLAGTIAFFTLACGLNVAWQYHLMVSVPEIRFGILIGGIALPDRRAEAVLEYLCGDPHEIIRQGRDGKLSAYYEPRASGGYRLSILAPDHLLSSRPLTTAALAQSALLKSGSIYRRISSKADVTEFRPEIGGFVPFVSPRFVALSNQLNSLKSQLIDLPRIGCGEPIIDRIQPPPRREPAPTSQPLPLDFQKFVRESTRSNPFSLRSAYVPQAPK